VAEVALDLLDHLHIGLPEAVHGLVGKDDAPAKGIVGTIALEHHNVAGGIGLLHQDREEQSGGAPAQAYDAHWNLHERQSTRSLFILYFKH
jgi:hypothetical protein